MDYRALKVEELIRLVEFKPDATPLERELAKRLAQINSSSYRDTPMVGRDTPTVA